jgi:hypothetical protein
MSKNPSQASGLMQPLGSTLRMKRGENENSPTRVLITRTTINHDSKSGLQQNITDALIKGASGAASKMNTTFGKDGTHSAMNSVKSPLQR